MKEQAVYSTLREFAEAHAHGDTKGARIRAVYWSVNDTIEIRTRGGLVLYRAVSGIDLMYGLAGAMGLEGVTA